MNGQDVRPTLERGVVCSRGRIVGNKLITAPPIIWQKRRVIISRPDRR